MGIIHDVPIADICAFLRFEGVLDESYQVMPKGDWQDFNGKRTYDIKRVVVTIEDAPNRHDLNCLALFGSLQVPEDKREQEILKRDKYESEVVYVLTAMKGAADFEIDTLPFEKDLSRVKTWGKKTASSR
ncbi:MAG: hypothetical protein M1368_02885 [Thaumarchaeota archaeon]|nr:hypothetical protein [Nitrososphaerota archaeon]